MGKSRNESILSCLSFRQDRRPVKAMVKQPRNVVLDFLSQQIALATAELDGRNYTVEKMRYVKDEEGKSVKARVAASPRRHYWLADGEWLLEVRYGNGIVELSPGYPSVSAGSAFTDVIATLTTIRTAVEAGEADEAIALASAKMRHKAAA